VKLGELIFDAVTIYSPCRNCDFWDRQGQYCYLKDVHPDTNKCLLVYQILKIIKEAGYVQLADDQSLPELPAPLNLDYREGYLKAQEDILKSGFRRVEL